MTGTEAALPMIRIIARRVPWPSLKERPERSGLRLRWDALREDTGEVLAAGTEHPMADACRVLTMRGVSGATPVTMRHADSPYDSFRPAALSDWAARGEKLAAKRAEAAALRERTAGNAPKVVEPAGHRDGQFVQVRP
jgi:hypothetical protein